MSLTSKVAFNTIIQIVGKIAVTAISLITIAYLTRYLGVAGYGAYTTIFAFVGFWAVIADFGFFWVMVRELSKPNSKKEYIVGNLMTLKFFFSLLVFLVCSLAAFVIPQYDWTLKIGIAVIAASWFWMSLNNTYLGLFQSQLEMYKTAVSELIGRAIILTGVVILVNSHSDLQYILATCIVGNVVNFGVNYVWSLKYVRFKPQFDWKYWKFLLIESLPLAILAIIGLVHFKIDTLILSLMKGTVDVGIYGVPYKILEIVLLIPSVFIGNVFPILTRYYHADDERLNGSIQKSFDFLVILVVPIVTGLIVLAEPTINFIAGKDYITASTTYIAGIAITAPKVLMILALAVGVSFFLNIFSSILTVINKQAKQIVPMVVITFINVTLNVIFIPFYSYFAAAVITFFTGLIMLFWWFKLSRQYLNFRLNFTIIGKALTAGLISAAVFYFSINLYVIFAWLIGIASYLVVGYFIKLYDLQMIKRIFPGK